ncbi:2Fe-2S iron-sulfur cluster-binding protein [Pseudoalteromonas sp. Hal273]|mgnify:CR=1 FL=1|uniref:2Fe-2S iron-sulfur cluster-binding protein n=1 Tax=Pseudoalteromonas TaxID=53246 RepID=UPI000BBC4C8A|nr:MULTISPECIES: 2Fe-2S iron-sulfur cluster-binding protein [Pseudoalteromonas]MCQ8876551.1 2Fe-2S iron-sulfur cluster-binding protein [Pseudoalteromonas shioyasakiensis]MCW1717217.1 2Fe-2S iron-sulfur cluster-binding protein [Pseudoalteromonas sp. A3]TMO09123.1 2Fe-2S ferredoxin [Pseudoalteromonas sp. S327]TMO19983.1 2Fe-2S ferredoxin [Pseudoalteromonas sp. S326]
MAKVIFMTQSNGAIAVEGSGGSLMELAVANGVSGIDGDCGGVCSCATCHVYVAPEDFEKVGAADEIESDMLELDDNVTEYSRLCCQIEVSDDIDGMTFVVAN